MTSQDIVAQLRRDVEGTPFLLEPTARGFTMQYDVADWKWATFLYGNGLRTQYKISVVIDDVKRTWAPTQHIREVRWQAGAGPNGSPKASLGLRAFVGEAIVITKTAQVGLHDDGRLVRTYTFDSRDLMELITQACDGAGYRRRRGAVTRFARGMAIFGGALAVAVLPVLWLLSVIFGWDTL
ncbi:hypothetical protein FLP10_14985 [Agromyces intestinalis]|uniref:Uncharacterized protein n=1 Tax=Agromyces intestinalis TaxID=2592652 RepID=A0A5C1YKD1_9MICO|nr:hypothetical protein [Agromyces intestinalis]QEO15589.1 hypothetical protein FLP10_14985 [Agromyces intestinalis]